jgi:S-adenosylmethionine decarboxylase proenzyme
MFRNILLGIGLVANMAAQEEYHFAGKHFFASYLDCDMKALTDLNEMMHAMDDAVEASGATLLNMSPHVFPPNAVTAVYLLSESHASIHTYPEHGACFVDLFTCGQKCSSEKFDAVLRAYLRPKRVNIRFFHRGEETSEISYSLPDLDSR